jgi:hypothetical protein
MLKRIYNSLVVPLSTSMVALSFVALTLTRICPSGSNWG